MDEGKAEMEGSGCFFELQTPVLKDNPRIFTKFSDVLIYETPCHEGLTFKQDRISFESVDEELSFRDAQKELLIGYLDNEHVTPDHGYDPYLWLDKYRLSKFLTLFWRSKSYSATSNDLISSCVNVLGCYPFNYKTSYEVGTIRDVITSFNVSNGADNLANTITYCGPNMTHDKNFSAVKFASEMPYHLEELDKYHGRYEAYRGFVTHEGVQMHRFTALLVKRLVGMVNMYNTCHRNKRKHKLNITHPFWGVPLNAASFIESYHLDEKYDYQLILKAIGMMVCLAWFGNTPDYEPFGLKFLTHWDVLRRIERKGIIQVGIAFIEERRIDESIMRKYFPLREGCYSRILSANERCNKMLHVEYSTPNGSFEM